MTKYFAPYKLAKVYNGPNEWFVFYHYWSLNKQKYLRVKVRIHQQRMEVTDRVSLLNAVRDELNLELRARNKRNEYHTEAGGIGYSDDTIVAWLKVGADEQGLEKNWRVCFSQVSSKLGKFYKHAPAFDDSTIHDLNELFLEAYVSFLKQDGLATKTINKHLWGLETLTVWLKRKGVMKARVETKEFRVDEIRNETNKYPPLSHAEKETAFNYFREKMPGYYLMLVCQYYTCIRPAELHRLRVGNFDLDRKTIFVPWLDSKNGLSAYVQILDPLVNALLAAGVDKLPAHYFLFGNKCDPAYEEYSGQFASNTWTKHRTKMGMPKDKQSYGLKHTFNVDYVENNKYKVDWEFLRRHNRHATIQQTQQYISSLTAYFLDQKNAVILDYTS